MDTRRLKLALALLLCISACSREPSSPADAGLDISLAKGTTTSDMSVSSATPDSATQDTTLDVVINGSGFVAGTVATWALAGVQDPAQVRTNSTRYVSSRQLVANITISASATAAKWDIAVTASGKKGGIGTETFTVKLRGNVDTFPRANVVWEDSVNVAAAGQPARWEPALITGDYRTKTGTPIATGKSGEYQETFCGSAGLLRTKAMEDTAYALNFDPDFFWTSSMEGPCGGGKRYYQFYFSGRGAAPLQYGPQHYALKLATLAVGQSFSEEVHFGIQQTNCAPLRFDSAYPPSTNALVTRLPDSLASSGFVRRWRVQSQGNHIAMCTVNTPRGAKPIASYYMPFAYVITEVRYPWPSYP